MAQARLALTLNMEAAWGERRGLLADPTAYGPPLQGALLLFSKLPGPGSNLAGAHGLLIFSIPGCNTTFYLKNASFS